MKRFISTLIVMLMITLSQANGKESTTKNSVSVAQPQTAIQNVRVHAKNKRIVKSKVQRAVPFGIDDNDDDFVQTDDIATGYRRRDLNKIEHEDDISEEVRWKLFLARQLAMLKHRELYA